MLVGNIDRTVDQIADRIDELLEWDKLVMDTWGDAEFSPKYKARQDAVFPEGADPNDTWNSPYDLDELLGQLDEGDK